MKVDRLLKYEFISFDIFDTLVRRDVKDCKDVFYIVENRYNENNKQKIYNFYKNRIKAEKYANEISKDEEITLEDIYNCLEKNYTKETCLKLKEIEKDTEINICVPNKKIIEIYKELLNNNKNIIITSDMYLDEETVKSILKKCNISNYKKLYLSSTIKKRKITGTLFDYIISDLKIQKNKLIHIGDNIINDFLIPKIKHINSIHVKNKENNFFYNKDIKKDYLKDYENLEKFISNNVDVNKDYYYKMGYETFGPILYGFVNYINDNFDKESKLFFLSRDGYIIQKAFNIINDRTDTKYFYASRRALIVPTLWKCDTFKEMLDKLYISDYIKIGKLFKKLGLEEKQYESVLLKHNYSIDYEIKREDLYKENFLIIFNEIKSMIFSNSKKEFDILVRYLNQENFKEKVSVIDIGWNGNMQKALVDISKIIDKDINIEGYYIGVVPESKNIGKIKMKGFLFDNKSNSEIYMCEKIINPVFESIFLAPHGSVKNYKIENEIVVPVLFDYEYKDSIERKSYESIQNGALQFIIDFIKSDIKYIIKFNPDLCFYNMMKLAYKPTNIDIEKFGDFRFFDEEITFIAKPKKIIFYLKNIKAFFYDLYNSGWKIGFLKRITKFNIFYKEIYLLYVKKYLKKRSKV